MGTVAFLAGERSAQGCCVSTMRAGFFFAAAAIFPGDPLRSQSDRSLALPKLPKPKVMTIDSKPMMQFLAIGRPCQLNISNLEPAVPPCPRQPTCLREIRPRPNLICL